MEDSWTDSDLIEDSKSEANILVPDSDNDDTRPHSFNISNPLTLESEEDRSYDNSDKLSKNNSRYSGQDLLNHKKIDKNKTTELDRDSTENIRSSIGAIQSPVYENMRNVDSENDMSHRESFKLHSKKNRNRIIESDEDSDEPTKQSIVKTHNYSSKNERYNNIENNPSKSQLLETHSVNINNKKEIKNISKDIVSTSALTSFSHERSKDVSVDSKKKGSFSPFNEDVFSSTRLCDDDYRDLPSTSTSNKSNSNQKNLLNIKNNKKLSIIDLTCLDQSTPNKDQYRNVIQEIDSEDESGNGKVVISDTESEGDTLDKKKAERNNDVSIVNQLSSLKISSGPTQEKKKESQNNDFLSRIDSLKGEEIRLKGEVSEVLKKIESVKSSLKAANLSALPDKGVRLQMSLKKEESKLRELRYQQSSLSNKIITLQMTSKVTQSLKPETVQHFSKLPTATTDVNAMGRKALETHRTQQALTVDALRALHHSLKNCPNEDTHVPDPKGLYVTLMPHQKHALAWMLWREKEKPAGGILADDMGLGKTLTMISLILKSNEGLDGEENEKDDSDSENHWLSSKRDKLVPGKTLVVCPATLIGQWEGEIKNRLKPGLLYAMIHHGQSREKKPSRLARPDVVITTYSILPREAAAKGPLFGIRWERVILDEAHQIRNYKTQTAQAVYQLKAKHRWALTGTPVHNKEVDIYSLLKFLRCAPFDDLLVWKRWVDNRDAAGIQRLNTITKSLMLRRTKQGLQERGQLKSLKDKLFHTIFIKLDADEKSAYEKLINFSSTLFAQFLHQKAEKENALPGMFVSAKSTHYLKTADNPFQNHPDLARLHRQMKEMSDIKSHHILVLILRLRQFCCHPALITTMFEKDAMTNDGIEDSDGLDLDLMDQMTRMSLAPATTEEDTFTEVVKGSTALSAENPLFAKERISSKMKKVLNVLEDILKSDDKVVVVSQWLSLLEVIHKVLKEMKVKSVALTGQVPVKDRAEIVERFNRKGHGPKVMLLSLTAGGVGLNLVGGNHLFLLDLHWNPQLESQACDRIYRVGQEKDVQVYKFVVSETIEERILNLQTQKLNMANDILSGAKHNSKLTMEDLKMLFQITK